LQKIILSDVSYNAGSEYKKLYLCEKKPILEVEWEKKKDKTLDKKSKNVVY
jgi:hypothetical protein